MKIKDFKCKCGHDDFTVMNKGKHYGAYCSYCGRWFKWLNKNELRIVRIMSIANDLPEVIEKLKEIEQ